MKRKTKKEKKKSKITIKSPNKRTKVADTMTTA